MTNDTNMNVFTRGYLKQIKHDLQGYVQMIAEDAYSDVLKIDDEIVTPLEAERICNHIVKHITLMYEV